MEELVCPRCGYAVEQEPPRCTNPACPLGRPAAWQAGEDPVRLIDY